MRNDWLFRFADWIGRLGAPQSLAAQQEPEDVHCGSFKLRVEKVVSELQPNGLGVQWQLHVNSTITPPFKLNVTEEIARKFQRGDVVEVEITLSTKEHPDG